MAVKKKICDILVDGKLHQNRTIKNMKKRQSEHELLRIYAHQTVVAAANGSDNANLTIGRVV